MPVNETLWLRDALAQDSLELDAVFVNALYPARFDRDEASELERALEGAQSPLARAAVRAALSEHARAADQRDQQARLSEGLGARLIELPYMFSEELSQPELELLADALAAGLSGNHERR
jgi:hypothetical protein